VGGLRVFRSPARSTVGAGDNVLAGVVVGLWRGMSPQDAIRFGMGRWSDGAVGERHPALLTQDVERIYTDTKILHDA